MRDSDLKLAAGQLDIVEMFGLAEAGWQASTGAVATRLGLDSRYARNYMGPRLMALARRGFLRRQLMGNRALWSAAPLIDALKERGLPPFDKRRK